MELDVKEAKEIIRAGFAWANWTEEQKQAFKFAYESIDKVEQLEKRLKELSQSNYCIICGDDATEVRQGQFYCCECCN